MQQLNNEHQVKYLDGYYIITEKLFNKIKQEDYYGNSKTFADIKYLKKYLLTSGIEVDNLDEKLVSAKNDFIRKVSDLHIEGMKRKQEKEVL